MSLEINNRIIKCITPCLKPIKQGADQQKLQLIKRSLGIFIIRLFHFFHTLTTSLLPLPFKHHLILSPPPPPRQLKINKIKEGIH